MDTTIILTEEEAKLFMEFQKRHAMIELLTSVGAFDLRLGRVIIDFDQTGQIGSVKVERTYRP